MRAVTAGEGPSGLDDNGQAASGTEVQAGRQKRKLLVVEDDFLLAIAMEDLLQNAGFDISGLADSAETAIELAEQTRPDLVIMDVRLRGPQDGVAAALEIWTRFRIRSLFITGNAETALSSRAAPANAAGVISKPYRDQDVLDTIGQALTTAQA